MTQDLDYKTLDIEKLDLTFVSETQIVEYISRNNLSVSALVNEILISNGFTTEVRPFGNDGSIEIAAMGGIGAFGFQSEKVAVLIKPNIEPADPDRAELEEFAALSSAPNAILASWTGFTEASESEAGSLFQQINVWDISKIVGLLSANYQALSPNMKLKLPLKTVAILASRKSG